MAPVTSYTDTALSASATTNSSITDVHAGSGPAVGAASAEAVSTQRTFVVPHDISLPDTTSVLAFSIPIGTSGRYLVEVFLDYTAVPAAGLLMFWSAPTGSTGRWSSGGVVESAKGRIGSLDAGMVGLDTALTVAGDGDAPGVEVAARPVLHLRTTTTGTLSFSVSQDNANATPDVVRAGSVLRITRVA